MKIFTITWTFPENKKVREKINNFLEFPREQKNSTGKD